MTRDETVDLLTFARVYDARVTLGKSEVAAWSLAIGRLPFDIARDAVTAHYTAPVELGHEVPRIAPGHVMSYYQAHNRVYDKPVPELTGPQADPAHVAECRKQIDALISEAADRWTLEDDDDEKEYGPKWRPGMDKRELAAAQAEASRRRREGGAS